MRLRAKLTWFTATVLALSAEGSAVAQSAPAPAGSASDPNLAHTEQGSASAGAQPETARANVGGKKKKSDPGAVDWSAMANRQEAIGNTGANGLGRPGGVGAPIQVIA